MTETNTNLNNSSFDDADELEFRVGEDDSVEHDLSGFGRDFSSEDSDDLDEDELEALEDEIAEADEEEAEELDEALNDEIDEAEDSNVASDNDTVVISKSKIVLIEKLLQNIKENNDQIIQLLGGSIGSGTEARINISQVSDENFTKNRAEVEDDSRVIEGVFDGENMIGPDGKQYSMPANYASKSKLVEGDIMKLTITEKGTFVYKQIGPIERRRVVGIIVQSESGNFYVVDESGHRWRVLTASITYYKGQVGDEAVILVPKNSDSKWAAVDNVVRKGGGEF